MDVLRALSDNIKRQIKDKRYKSIELFAHENGLDKGNLSRILNCKIEPKFTTMIKIAQALEVTLNDLYMVQKKAINERPTDKNRASKKTNK